MEKIRRGRRKVRARRDCRRCPPHNRRGTEKGHSFAAGEFTAQAADQYRRLLSDVLAGLRTANCTYVGDGIVWVRFGWEAPGLLVSAAATINSSPALQADWSAAARGSADENTSSRGLLTGG